MFIVFGDSAFLQVTENPKDFKPAKKQKPPVPYTHKVLLVLVGIRGSEDRSKQLQFSLFGCYFNFLLPDLRRRRHMFVDRLVVFLFVECHKNGILCE